MCAINVCINVYSVLNVADTSLTNLQTYIDLYPDLRFNATGSAGHVAALNMDTVYVLIEGRTCLQIYLNSNPTGYISSLSDHSGSSSTSGDDSSGGRGHITVGTERGPETGDPFWAYKSAQTVTVARRDMPIVRLEAGTIVNLVSEHFTIGQAAGGAQEGRTSSGDAFDHDSSAIGGSAGNISDTGASFLPPITQKKTVGTGAKARARTGTGTGTGAGAGTGTGNIDPGEYSIRFLNETAIIYLAIPRKVSHGHAVGCICISRFVYIIPLALFCVLTSAPLHPLFPAPAHSADLQCGAAGFVARAFCWWVNCVHGRCASRLFVSTTQAFCVFLYVSVKFVLTLHFYSGRNHETIRNSGGSMQR